MFTSFSWSKQGQGLFKEGESIPWIIPTGLVIQFLQLSKLTILCWFDSLCIYCQKLKAEGSQQDIQGERNITTGRRGQTASASRNDMAWEERKPALSCTSKEAKSTCWAIPPHGVCVWVFLHHM
ncbi:hypothetical protein OPV22_032155 [Ensete ventricosum]|uniref:Uncharacterized protein n=1 Tax=Ensete ventricosum TaxID=4639 RepID=A0AAV8PQX3_ENSVE|nr:hypothetical protein OPV22_032155 [Ensete ventricosum]